MDREGARSTKGSLPLRKIEKLILMAIRHNLHSLEVGDIKVVPRPKLQPAEKQEKLSLNGKPLTHKQMEDYYLFGPTGIMEEDG